ncbi:hypothetical protein QTG54_010776 [Skeletonema marinoi]|uniref:Cellulase n=1 Tax=Skeletonema marinoi TaxID=267567 RepID=A0AAD9D919_9STRA|nr:hypothetical protein QTG54_010776 [Skeletonema marinoi]
MKITSTLYCITLFSALVASAQAQSTSTCAICGEGNVVGAPDAIFDVELFGISYPCGDFEASGLAGQIPQMDCAFLQPGGLGASYIDVCECMPAPAPALSTPTSDPTTYEPSSAGPTTLEPTSSEPTTYEPSIESTTHEPSLVATTDDIGDRTIDNNSTCIDTPGWSDIDNFPCSWYEEHDATGCPIYGDSFPWKFKDGVIHEPFGDGTANQNCCHCKNAVPTPRPTSSCSGDTPDWEDVDHYTCAWYEANDAPGCPRYGNAYEGGLGVANENCCWCRGTGAPSTLMPTSDFPTIVLVPTPSPTADETV